MEWLERIGVDQLARGRDRERESRFKLLAVEIYQSGAAFTLIDVVLHPLDLEQAGIRQIHVTLGAEHAPYFTRQATN